MGLMPFLELAALFNRIPEADVSGSVHFVSETLTAETSRRLLPRQQAVKLQVSTGESPRPQSTHPVAARDRFFVSCANVVCFDIMNFLMSSGVVFWAKLLE
jgi:hypothetical protein